MVGLVRGVEVISGENFNSPLDCSKRSLLTKARIFPLAAVAPSGDTFPFLL